MNASQEKQCQHCGVKISANSTEGLCPACLMSRALSLVDGEAETVSPGLHESLRHGVSEFPCEFGPYRLLGLLGRGGMGTVYEAEDMATARRVALKMLAQQLDSPDMRQRFLREGRLAAQVNHPNSLYVFGSEEIEGLSVITMEIAGSGTLKDQLKQRGPLPVTDAVDAILDVISGLEAALSAGVLHRDIKPSNCFVCPDGAVKVGDFGLSVSTLARDDMFVTAHGKIMGTPAYASPEQLRGDALDVRADIYSVGATLFTLLTNRAPFEGDNAVQVVANAVNQKPKPLTELRDDIPSSLERVVTCCLSKEPNARYIDYTALRNALLPFSSRVPEPASIKVRVSVGWIDYLIAFLIPYVILMLTVGAEALLIEPLRERTLYSMRYYFALFMVGILYFSVAEGIWGAGVGKYLKGLRVVRANGRAPGIGRALIRIVLPILCVEGVRMPLMMALTPDSNWTGLTTVWFVLTANICAWIPVLLMLRAHRKNDFATVWDLASGTRVVIKPSGTIRPSIESPPEPAMPEEDAEFLGPYMVSRELIPGKWMVGADPVLRREVWLIKRTSETLPLARRTLARHGRVRWLQKVDTPETTWDAFEAPQGLPFSSVVKDGTKIPWSSLRFWLHDLATELWEAAGDQTLLTEMSLDHVWITTRGHAVLLDQPWPQVQTHAESFPVNDLAGRHRFLDAVARCVESTTVPLHARRVLQNLANGKFEKLSFLTGTLRGLLYKPAELSKGIRAASIFMLPLYIWIAVFVGRYHDKSWTDYIHEILILSPLWVLGAMALMQFLTLPLRSTASHAIFRLAVINGQGEPAHRMHLLARWAVVWLPLFVPMLLLLLLIRGAQGAGDFFALTWLALWISAAIYAVVFPNRGLHDRWARTWVVRR
ncbi:protein kinase [Planctomycetota bacterium]